MSRREELEEEVIKAQKKIDEAPENTPQEVKNLWNVQLNNIFIELNNLYDDDENEQPD